MNLNGWFAAYTKINLKGTRKKDMPRLSKKRGKHKTSLVSKELSGISHHKVCIVTAIDEHDNILYKVAGQGSESQATFEQLFLGQYMKSLFHM